MNSPSSTTQSNCNAEKMNWPPDPKSWFEFPLECLWYLFPGLVAHLTALVVSLLVFALLRCFKCRLPRLSTLILFQGYLLLAAMLANGFWSCAVWGNLYWSVDYTSDFSAFFPISSDQIEYSWGPQLTGGLNGITLSQLNAVWASFILGAWLLAIGATWWTLRSMNMRHASIRIRNLENQSS